MEIQESREASTERAQRSSIETVYQYPVLGWSRRQTPINSLAPFGNLITTSTGEPKVQATVDVMPESRFGAPTLVMGGVAERFPEVPQQGFASGSRRIARIEGVTKSFLASEQHIFDFEVASLFSIPEAPWGGEAIVLGEGQRHSEFRVEPRIVRGPGIDAAPGVDEYARRVGATEDVSVIAELCLRFIPHAKRVLVTVSRDPEDGTTGLHFLTWTTAAIEAIVNAEDEFHQALFSRIPPDRRSFFSIGYEFVR